MHGADASVSRPRANASEAATLRITSGLVAEWIDTPHHEDEIGWWCSFDEQTRRFSELNGAMNS